jgi:DNA-binding HxlR family transcriptional regulator
VPVPHDAPAVTAKCPIELTLEAIGERWKYRWKALIVWHLFWGARPFGELLRSTLGLTRSALRRELREMERSGLVRKEPRPGARRKAQYALTPSGESLKPMVCAMYEWGLRGLGRARLHRRLGT